MTSEAGEHRGVVVVSIANGSDVTEQQLAAGGAVDQGQGGKILLQISLLGGFQLQIKIVIAQYRCGGAGGVLVDRLLNVVEGQSIGLQARLIDLDSHHRIEPAVEVYLTDVGVAQQVRAQ